MNFQQIFLIIYKYTKGHAVALGGLQNGRAVNLIFFMVEFYLFKYLIRQTFFMLNFTDSSDS